MCYGVSAAASMKIIPIWSTFEYGTLQFTCPPLFRCIFLRSSTESEKRSLHTHYIGYKFIWTCLLTDALVADSQASYKAIETDDSKLLLILSWRVVRSGGSQARVFDNSNTIEENTEYTYLLHGSNATVLSSFHSNIWNMAR